MRLIQDRQQVVRRRPVYHGWRRIAYSWPALILLALVVILIGRSTWRVYSRWDMARGERNQASARLAAEADRRAHLEAEVERLSTLEGQEEEIRSNFPVAKEGEGVIILVGTSTE